MQVVHVVAVLHGFVGAVGSAMLMLCRGMFGRVIMFVVMAVVFGMSVAVMQVVHVVAVLHGFMGAVRPAVLVLRETVFGVNFLGHYVSLSCWSCGEPQAGAPPGWDIGIADDTKGAAIDNHKKYKHACLDLDSDKPPMSYAAWSFRPTVVLAGDLGRKRGMAVADIAA
jgi:hypothetical protein